MPQVGERRNRKDGRAFAEWNGSAWVEHPMTATAAQPTSPTDPAAIKLTEDQGKVQGYARLMRLSEKQYQGAQQKGFDYNSARNAFADQLEAPAPVVGAPLAFLSPLVRGDAADEARKSQRVWQDAQLKAMTGAGQGEREATEADKSYFPKYGEAASAAQNAEETRATAYDAARDRAGPAGRNLPKFYWDRKEKGPDFWGALPPAQKAAATRFAGSNARPGTDRNPFVPGDAAEYNALPPGSVYIHHTGAIKRKP